MFPLLKDSGPIEAGVGTSATTVTGGFPLLKDSGPIEVLPRRLCQQGFNINASAKKNKLQTWPGEYTGLQVISIMYAAFQQFAPTTDLGIDLSRKYLIATQQGQ